VRVDPERGIVRAEGHYLGRRRSRIPASGAGRPERHRVERRRCGFTMGGDFGWTFRKFCYAADNLLSIDIITADGQHRGANESGIDCR
jgi:hypothetical protein